MTPELEALEKLVDPYFSGPQFTKAAMRWIGEDAPVLIERHKRMERALRNLEISYVGAMDAIAPHASYEGGNRFADRDPAVIEARAALADAPERDGGENV